MSALLHRLGLAVTRHRGAVIATWVVLAVATILAANALGTRTSVDISLPNTGSQSATDLLTAEFPSQAQGSSPIVMKTESGQLTEDKYQQAIADATKALKANDLVASVAPVAISKGGTVGYINITLSKNLGQVTKDEAEDLADAATAPLEKAGLETAIGGALGQVTDEETSDTSEGIGILAAILILLLTFGSAVAMGVPIVTAIFGLATAISLITVLGHVFGIPSTGPVLATMIGLGVGIDYALFIVTRHREGLSQGLEPDESIAKAIATSGAAVVFAGFTVIIALCSLAVARIPIVTAMGVTSALAVLIAMIAAITLLPAILALLGRRLNALRLPWRKGEEDPDGSPRWAKFAHEVCDRPWIALGISLAILLPLAAPVIGLTLGQPDTDALPKDDSERVAYDDLAEGFGPGFNGPFVVAVKVPKGSEDAVSKLESGLKSTHGVAAVSPAQKNDSGEVVLLTVFPTTGPSDGKTADLVDTLRDEVVPKALEGTKAVAYVGGLTAGYVDLADRIADSLPWLIALVIVLSCLLLLVAFRSVVLPLKAALMNLLSVAAAYGVLTLVFQEGHGAGLIGLEGAVPVVSYVPLMMFAILFGLSMDYEVFLLSRIREHHDAGESTHDAVVSGLASSARVITAAATIMVVVFGSFVLNDDPTVKQFGLGMAVAVFIDATVVRCLLVPSLMVLLRDANWWLPGWLDRILPPLGLDES
ncbi:MAG: MMPL family transporter [Solirubrobacteraceae bacterium]|nr:MMPL family transporter [Solirubrobacteraceae bacterium]